MSDIYKTLCIGGGSIRGLCELGALHYLNIKKIYDIYNIDTICGTSIGSAIALLLAVGYEPMDILQETIKIKKIMDFDLSNFLHFKRDGGVLDISNFTIHIEKLVEKKMGYIPTLQELYDDTGIKLVVTVTNVSFQQSEYLSYDNHPNLSCISAIKMSCNLPIIFKRIEFDGCYYADGGILDNFPIEYACSLNKDTKVIGVSVCGKNTRSDSLFSYIYTLTTLSVTEIQRLNIEKCKTLNALMINLTATNTPPLSFNLTETEKMQLFCEGYNMAEEIYTRKTN